MTRILRLKHVLQEHCTRLGGHSALAREINKAHAAALGIKSARVIERRKIGDFLAGKNVSLKIRQLEAIDDFLNNYHQGLAYMPIFERTTLLPALVACREVHFLVGARALHGNLSVSHYDTNAYAALVRALNDPSPGVTCELEIALLRGKPEEARIVESEPWQRILETERAVVAIASPLSNPAPTPMLLQMLHLSAHASPFERRRSPEFAFVLPQEYQARNLGPFVESPDQLPPAKARLIKDRRWALRMGAEVLVAEAEDEKHPSKTYAILVAQRRANGHLWVVAAGLHGAGTHAAALALPGADISLASGRQGEDGPVHVRVVEALVSTTTSNGTMVARVEDQRILTKYSRTFDPRTQADGAA